MFPSCMDWDQHLGVFLFGFLICSMVLEGVQRWTLEAAQSWEADLVHKGRSTLRSRCSQAPAQWTCEAASLQHPHQRLQEQQEPHRRLSRDPEQGAEGHQRPTVEILWAQHRG